MAKKATRCASKVVIIIATPGLGFKYSITLNSSVKFELSPMPISLLLSTKFVKKLFQPMSFRFGIQYFAQIKGDHQSMATKKVYLCSKSKSMWYMSNYIAVYVCSTVPTLFFDKSKP